MEEKIVVHVEADLEDLIPGYLENRLADVKSISQALEAQAYGTIQGLAHSFKGSGAAYGFDRISLIGEQMEGAAKEEDREAVAYCNDQLLSYLNRVEVVFEE